MGDVDHLLGDDPGPGELVLRHHLARGGLAQRALGRAGGDELVGGGEAVVLGLHFPGRHGLVAAGRDPRRADLRQAGGEVDAGVGLGVRARRVVDPHRRLFRIGQHDLAERDADVVPAGDRGVDLAGAGDRTGGHGLGASLHILGQHGCVHLASPGAGAVQLRDDDRGQGAAPQAAEFPSLRRYEPDQVQGSGRSPNLSPLQGPPRNGSKLGGLTGDVNGMGRDPRDSGPCPRPRRSWPQLRGT